MSTPDLTPERDAPAQGLAPVLAQAPHGDRLQMTRLLASKPDPQVPGQTEFQLRDIVPQFGVKAIQLEARDRTGRGPEALEEHRSVTGYGGTTASRMDAPTPGKDGWQGGSGSMGSGCKAGIGPRLCGGGRRGGLDGAESVSHLRAPSRSGPSQGEAFWSRGRN